MKRKILNFIIENKMLSPGDKVLIALSGGPDSVCMLHILASLREELSIECFAAHVNHCLRGDEALKDQQYSEELCRSLSIPFFVTNVNIAKLAKDKGISVEMAGREARYRFFQELKEKLGLDKVALAHNANDQAETLLMRIMRGTGVEGLRGIRPIRDDIFIRPILCLSRQQIEDYCIEHDLKPRIDQSNLEELYARNKVRLKLIPYIQENFNPEIIASLNRLSELVNMDNEYIEQQANIYFSRHCKCSLRGVVIASEAFTLPEAMVNRLIRKAYATVAGNSDNFLKLHVDEVIALQKQGTGKSISLPGGIIAENIYGSIEVFSSDKITKASHEKETILEDISSMEVKLLEGFRIYSRIFKGNIVLTLIKGQSFNKEKSAPNIKYFDFDKMQGSIIIRNREAGDRFNPLGMKGSKKLKDIFIDIKLPKAARDSIPLLCVDNEIAWIFGYNISDKYKVDKCTRNLLKVKVESEDDE